MMFISIYILNWDMSLEHWKANRTGSKEKTNLDPLEINQKRMVFNYIFFNSK